MPLPRSYTQYSITPRPVYSRKVHIINTPMLSDLTPEDIQKLKSFWSNIKDFAKTVTVSICKWVLIQLGEWPGEPKTNPKQLPCKDYDSDTDSDFDSDLYEESYNPKTDGLTRAELEDLRREERRLLFLLHQ